ncbi:hypothetical protein ACFXK0_06185 [Nocardia sp. NPDC059177]|uniref:LppU/SCO3897 family protein n=1 Tax=Nocardia sp. NPDC059177 TaxID=3346759 RepID=UPI0036C9E319
MFFPGKRLLARLVFAPVATVALVGAVVACSSGEESAASVSAGSCVEITDNSADAMTASLGDCGSAATDYRIAQVVSAPADCAVDTAIFTGTVGDTETTLCLTPNFAEGKCYADAGTRPAESVECSAPEATFKVVQRIDGATDELQCGAGATQFRFAKDPEATFCLAKP